MAALRSGLRWLLAGGLGAGLLWWALRGVSWDEVGAAVAGADPLWLAAGLLGLVPSFALRARRWGTLLGAGRPAGPVGSFRVRHAAIYIGFAGNCLLPAHAGELARASALRAAGGVPLGAALGSIAAERLLDAVVVFAFLVVPWLGLESGDGLRPVHVALMGGGLAAAIAALVAAARRSDGLARLAGRACAAVGLRRLAPRVERAAGAVLGGLAVLRRPRRCAVALLESVGIWVSSAVLYWAVMRGLGIEGPGPLGALFVQSVAVLGIALPSTPGYFGPYEAAVRLALAPYAVPPGQVVACALVLHALIFVTVTAVGVVCAARLGVPLLRSAARPAT